ncbi:MAG: T9SS type A sorting domain-containing protein [Dysgonamonadaceae bacterium]|nr:T9SS type A sorting domain-containing protein [Dysgonamonadaceae bacterium]
MKTKIFSLVLCLLSMHAYGQVNLISNGDFESWGTLSTTSWTGVLQGINGSNSGADPALIDWTYSSGNGNLDAFYQYNQAESNTYSVVMKNTLSSSSRIVSPLTSSALEAGKTYKLTFWVRGKGTLQNITLTESDVTINGNTATNTPPANNKTIFPNNTTSALNDVLDLGTIWTKKEYIYTVSVAGKYKLSFFFINTAGSLTGLNTDYDNYFLLDNVSLVEYEVPILSELKVRNNSVPGFSSQILSYNIVLQSNIASPYTVTATAANAQHTVDITQAANLTGTEAERKATIVVTAETETKTYTVIFSKTTEWIREGFSSDAIYSPFTNEGNTWLFDELATWNNGVFLGDKSIRPRANLEAILTISNIVNVGTLSFYIKDRDFTNASPTLYIDYKDPSDVDWTNCTNVLTISDSYPAYTQINVPINRSAATDIRFRVTKADAYAGYQLDDISLSAYSQSTSVSPSSEKQFIGSDGKTIHLTATDKAFYQILSPAGQTLSTGDFENSRQITSLSPGIYIVRLTTQAGEVVKKIILYQ